MSDSLDQIRRLIGIEKKTSLNDSESNLYSQLQSNRERVSQQIVPEKLRKEFLKTIYPDSNLVLYAQAFYLGSKLENKMAVNFVLYHMAGSLSIKGFGRRLLMQGIRPEAVFSEMLHGI